jgi:hypothetical protein
MQLFHKERAVETAKFKNPTSCAAFYTCSSAADRRGRGETCDQKDESRSADLKSKTEAILNGSKKKLARRKPTA